ncbi:MAG: hypothetical protein ACOH1Y_17055 [Propionicimonas sp.]
MNDLEERLRADFQAVAGQVEDRIDAEAALLAGQRARSSRRIARTVGVSALAAVVGLVGWGFLQGAPALGGHPDPMGTVSATPSLPSTSSSPYVPTDPMSATFQLGGTINGQVPSYESVRVSVEAAGDRVDVTVALRKDTAKNDESPLLRHYTMTAGKFWWVALDKHLLLSIVPGRPTWFQSEGDDAKGSVTYPQPLTGINATAHLTGLLGSGGPDKVRGFLWRGADGVAHDSLGNVVPSTEIALKDDTYWIYRDAALDVLGIDPKQGGGSYGFRISDVKPGQLVDGGMGEKADGGKWSWTNFGALPPGAHDLKLVLDDPVGDWGSATLSDGWVVVVAHATAKTRGITSVSYTGADGNVVTYHS